MRKKLTTWLLCAMLAICGVVGALTLGTSANAEGDEPAEIPDSAVIQKVTGNATGNMKVSDEEWATLTEHAMTGTGEGSVKFAIVGTDLYYRAVIKDETKSPSADAHHYKITTDGKSEEWMAHYGGVIGDFWANWTIKGFGDRDPNFISQSYNDETQQYIQIAKCTLGNSYKDGEAVEIIVNHKDQVSLSGHANSGATLSFSGTLYLGEKPTPVNPVSNDKAEATKNAQYVTLWSDGDEHETITMGGTESNISGSLPEVTYKIGETLTAAKNVRMTTTVKLKTDQADANSWRKVSLRIAEGIVFYVQWNDNKNTYDAGVGIADSLEDESVISKADLPAWLTIDAIKAGVTFKVERAGHKLALYAQNDETFVKLAETTCHAAADTVVAVRGGYCTWEFTDTTVETFTPETATVPQPADMLIKGVAGAVGKPTETEWAELAKHYLNGNNDGYLQFATVGTTLWIRAQVEDTTSIVGSDALNFSVSTGNTVITFTMNMEAWSVDSLVSGAALADIQRTSGYNDAQMKYTATVGFPLGDDYADEAKVDVSVTYRDASAKHGTGAALDSGTATTYEAELTIEEPEAPIPPVEDPVNTDLKIVVTDLPSQPKESDWANATAYDLIALHGGTEGSTGTIKIFTAAQNIFFRVEINDPTTHTNADRKYIYLGTEDVHYEARGNWENWLQAYDGHGNAAAFGQPSLMSEKTTAKDPKGWTPGVYTWDYGVYLKAQSTGDILWEEGAQIRLCVKFGDSQSAAQSWADNDYDHTIYFDQIITFGPKADTTVRPQTPTEGFTGTASEIKNTNVKIDTQGFAGAETYKFFLFGVNPAGSEEPYEHIETAGPAYSDELPYQLFGLSATTDYVVQIVAYDDSDAPVAYSQLIEFRTLSIQEVTNKTAADAVIKKIDAIGEVTLEKESAITEARTAYDALTAAQKELISADTLKKLTDAETALAALKTPDPGNGGNTEPENGGKKKKCGSVAGGGALAIALVMLGACSVLVLRRKEER